MEFELEKTIVHCRSQKVVEALDMTPFRYSQPRQIRAANEMTTYRVRLVRSSSTLGVDEAVRIAKGYICCHDSPIRKVTSDSERKLRLTLG